MGLIARNKGGGDFKPAPSGSHPARCCWMIDLGVQPSELYGAKHQVLIGWELPTELIEEGERAGEPYFISNFYTMSLHAKANLRLHLEAWRGREFTEAELEGFDLRNILDKPCMLTVGHKKKDNGDIRAKVIGVSSLPKGLECPPRVNPLREYDGEDPDQEAYEALPEWLQEIISKGKHPNEHKAEQLDPAPAEDPESECPF